MFILFIYSLLILLLTETSKNINSTTSPFNSVISTTSDIDPDDLLSSSRQDSVDHWELSSRDKDDKSKSKPGGNCKRSLSEHTSVNNDSDQELLEDYSHQIDCLKEEMLIEFPVVLPGILPIYDSHNLCTISSDMKLKTLTSTDSSDKSHDSLNNSEIDQLVTDLVISVIESAEVIVEYNIMMQNVEYSKLLSDTAENLINSIITESMDKINNDYLMNAGIDDDISLVLEPDSPLTEDGEYFCTYGDSGPIKDNLPKFEVFIQDNNIGMILQGTGDDCDLAPLSPIMECIETEKSPECLSDRNIELLEDENGIKRNKFGEFDESKSSSLKEFEQIEGDLIDQQSPIQNLVKETAIIDDIMDVSDSTLSSLQCSVICASLRTDSLQLINSESAAGLAIDLQCPDSRTTSMNSSIMQISGYSTDSTTLTTTTTTSTTALIKVFQNYDELASISINSSLGCMSSGSEDH